MIVNILFVWPICIPQKLGLQYILVGLCLVLFHSVGDHWQDKGVEIGELCNIIFFWISGISKHKWLQLLSGKFIVGSCLLTYFIL